jgi:DNA-binding beta-propeller fold protein YncE
VPAIADTGAARLTIKGDWLTSGAGGIWLTGNTAVHRLDPRTGHPVADVRVRQGPCEASDFGFGAVWTATCRVPGLAKIDPSRNRVVAHVRLTIPATLDGEGSVGAGEGGVWLVTDGSRCRQCRVTRIDPHRLTVSGTVAVEPGAATVRTGAGAVWVANPDLDIVQRIDPAALKVLATVQTGSGPRFFAVGEGAVWTLNQGDGSVTRIALDTGKPTQIDAGVPGEGGDLTVGRGSVWVRATRTLLTRIDTHSNRVVARYGPPSGSGAVILGPGAVWVSAHDIRTVWRIPLQR